jgi:hypothetical protein
MYVCWCFWSKFAFYEEIHIHPVHGDKAISNSKGKSTRGFRVGEYKLGHKRGLVDIVLSTSFNGVACCPHEAILA